MESSASKKGKICHDDDDDHHHHHHHQEEEDNEEEKMEKFFALVKSIREARDRLMGTSCATKEIDNNRRTKRKLEENKPVEVWKPTFQREDFLEETDRHRLITHPHASLGGSSQTKQAETDQKEDKKEGLDLTLSL